MKIQIQLKYFIKLILRIKVLIMLIKMWYLENKKKIHRNSATANLFFNIFNDFGRSCDPISWQ